MAASTFGGLLLHSLLWNSVTEQLLRLVSRLRAVGHLLRLWPICFLYLQICFLYFQICSMFIDTTSSPR